MTLGSSEFVFHGGHDDLALPNGPVEDASEERKCVGLHAENHVLSLKQSKLFEPLVFGPSTYGNLDFK